MTMDTILKHLENSDYLYKFELLEHIRTLEAQTGNIYRVSLDQAEEYVEPPREPLPKTYLRFDIIQDKYEHENLAVGDEFYIDEDHRPENLRTVKGFFLYSDKEGMGVMTEDGIGLPAHARYDWYESWKLYGRALF